MTAKKYTLQQSTSGLTAHFKNKYPGIHRSDRHKEHVDLYSVLGVINDGSTTYWLGHIYGPHTKDEVKYTVSFPDSLPPQITILNPVSDRTAAIQAAEDQVSLLYAKSLLPSGGGGGNNMKGYYLWSEPPGATGLNRFNQAKANGLVNTDFIESCKKIKISMRHYK